MMSIYISSPPRIDVISCFQALPSYPAHSIFYLKKKKLYLDFEKKKKKNIIYDNVRRIEN